MTKMPYVNKESGLKYKQRLFAEAYIDPNSDSCANAYKSAIKANYSKSSAKQACVRLVDNVGIKEYMVEYLVKIKSESIASRAQRQAFWTGVYNDSKTSMSDRLRASELLGRSEADFTDNIANTTTKAVKPFTEEQIAELKALAKQATFKLSKIADKAVG